MLDGIRDEIEEDEYEEFKGRRRARVSKRKTRRSVNRNVKRTTRRTRKTDKQTFKLAKKSGRQQTKLTKKAQKQDAKTYKIEAKQAGRTARGAERGHSKRTAYKHGIDPGQKWADLGKTAVKTLGVVGGAAISAGLMAKLKKGDPLTPGEQSEALKSGLKLNELPPVMGGIPKEGSSKEQKDKKGKGFFGWLADLF